MPNVGRWKHAWLCNIHTNRCGERIEMHPYNKKAVYNWEWPILSIGSADRRSWYRHGNRNLGNKKKAHIDFFLYLCKLKQRKHFDIIAATDSIAGSGLRAAAGGKSGQHESPYFLTGRGLGGKSPVHSKCHRKINRHSKRVGKGASARQELTTEGSDTVRWQTLWVEKPNIPTVTGRLAHCRGVGWLRPSATAVLDWW